MAAPKGNQYYKLAETTGRPPTFETPLELIRVVNSYIEHVEQNPIKIGKTSTKSRPYTIQGLANFIGCTVETLNSYGKKDKDQEHAQEFLRVLTRVKEMFFAQKFDGAAVGIFQHNIIARDLGLEDKKRIIDKPKQVVEVQIIDGQIQEDDKPQ